MSPANGSGAGGGGDSKSAAAVGPWHFALALLGIVAIALAVWVFRSVFTTAGDVLALLSYIAAIIGAPFGVKIAVRGGQAAAENKVKAAENKVKKEAAQNATKDLASLKSDVESLSQIVRTIGNSPAGQTSFQLNPGEPIQLPIKVEIPGTQLENIQVRLASIEKSLNLIAT